MRLSRRAMIGLSGGLFVGISGCVEATADTASDCVSSPSDDAKSPSEVREALPEYEGEAVDRDEHWERVDEIQQALWDAVAGHPWRRSMGQTMDDGELILVVSATCKPRARRYIPQEWGGVTIRLRQAIRSGGQAASD